MVQDTAVVWWNHVAALHGIALLLSQVVDLVVDLVVELGSRADLVVELSPRDNSVECKTKRNTWSYHSCALHMRQCNSFC